MKFKITYKMLDGEQGPPAIIHGPEGATVAKCVRIIGLACSVYKIDMSSLEVKEYKEPQTTYGFLHPITAMVEGRAEPVPIEGWYF